MRPWELLDTSPVAGQAHDLKLYRRGDEYSIKTGPIELMNSRMHASEDVLAELGCKHLRQQRQSKVLVGGLGMGFTLAKTLECLTDDAEVVVAELVPAVVQWNQSHLAHLAHFPLKDSRVQVFHGDVGQLMSAKKLTFDAILLDVDNGPEGLTRQENEALYSLNGLKNAAAALKSGGILGVWSAFPAPKFTKRMQQAGFHTQEVPCRAFAKKGSKHMVWLGKKK
ncbi:MAG: hypothetical protein Q9M19_00135 [Mariprofundaceae bacterium]|nr:hypothetical protein [Mariprofundaceae bacterium]